jgi:hypothetical protein
MIFVKPQLRRKVVHQKKEKFFNIEQKVKKPLNKKILKNLQSVIFKQWTFAQSLAGNLTRLTLHHTQCTVVVFRRTVQSIYSQSTV